MNFYKQNIFKEIAIYFLLLRFLQSFVKTGVIKDVFQ